MQKIRLDNGIEYDAAPEVAAAVAKLRQDNADLAAAKDAAEAERDVAKADLQALQDKQPEIEAAARQAAQQRAALEAEAQKHGVEVKADMDDTAIKTAVIKALRGDGIKLDGKSADYINAVYDVARADYQPDAAKQRQAARTDAADAPPQRKTAAEAKAGFSYTSK